MRERERELLGLDDLNFPTYKAPQNLTVITTYFNACGYKTRRRNYDLFVKLMRDSGVPCITVECAFGDNPFELEDSLDVIQVRSDCVLWQKERLLNLAASWLPASCRYVAWLDCDLVFQNPNWAVDAERLLERFNIVQLFESCARLNEGNCIWDNPSRVPSFASIVPNDRNVLNAGNFDKHGHTGYAWAMRREIFDQVGLYEHAICGTGDHFMAHAVYGNYGFCINQAFKGNQSQIRHLKDWGSDFESLVRGNLAAVPGEVLHLWHGDTANRKYLLRMYDLGRLGFDSWRDIVAPPGQPLLWHPDMDKPDLRDYFMRYFESRREDGEPNLDNPQQRRSSHARQTALC